MKTQDILTKVDHKSGLTVPVGYFENFNKQMVDSLPQRPWENEQPILQRSIWQRVRPYVYMAAMFAGIWCMMKLFDIMRPTSNMTGFGTNSELTAALNNDDFYYDYCVSSVDEATMYDALYDAGFNPNELNYQ